MTDDDTWTISRKAGPTLCYVSSDGTAFTKIDEETPTDPRERALLRALLHHALTLLADSEPTRTNGAGR